MIYVFPCGRHQQPVHKKQLSKNHQRLKYKQCKRKIREGGDADLNKISLEHKIPNVDKLMEIPLDRFITLAENYCVCKGTNKELVVNWVDPLFLNS